MNVENANEKRRKAAAIAGATAAAVGGIAMSIFAMDYIPREPYVNEDDERNTYLASIIGSESECRHLLRMNIESFVKLVAMCRDKGLLKDTRNVKVEEQMAEFLHTIGHNVKNRVLNHNFKRSGETVSRYFHIVLQAVLNLQDDLLKQPTRDSETPTVIKYSKRFWPWFEENAYAKDLLNVPLDDYENLRLVCGEDLATGSYAKTNSESQSGNVDEATSATQDVVGPSTAHQPNEKHKKRSRQCFMEEAVQTMSGLTKQVALLTDAIGSDQEFCSLVFEEVMKIVEFDDHVLNKAFEYLTQHPLKGRQFIARRQQMRVDWLKNFASGLN